MLSDEWRDGNGNGNANGNANADAKVSTIALPVLCTGELKMVNIHVHRFTSFEHCLFLSIKKTICYK